MSFAVEVEPIALADHAQRLDLRRRGWPNGARMHTISSISVSIRAAVRVGTTLECSTMGNCAGTCLFCVCVLMNVCWGGNVGGSVGVMCVCFNLLGVGMWVGQSVGWIFSIVVIGQSVCVVGVMVYMGQAGGPNLST